MNTSNLQTLLSSWRQEHKITVKRNFWLRGSMRRLLTSILIIAVCAMQSISLSHVHLPCGPEEAEHHSGLPHFHLHGGHSHAAHDKELQHKNDEQEFAATLHEAHHVDHDFNACYLSNSLASNAGLMRVGVLTLLTAFTLNIGPERINYHAFVLQQHVRQFAICLGGIARVPLYLRSLAILC
jgi:hypothetical protein